MKTENTLTIWALAFGLILYSGTITRAVVLTPGNVILPTSPGESLSFDFVLADAMGTTAIGFQITVGLTGPGTLIFNQPAGLAVDADPDYWVYENSYQAVTHHLGANWYVFGDNPRDPPYELLDDGDIMARFSFIWDGTPGDYTFTIDFATTKSFVMNDLFHLEPLQFTPQTWVGDEAGLIVVPEPATVIILALGGMVLLGKRKP